jgi:N-acetylmuramoyl-L-alanine amidase
MTSPNFDDRPEGTIIDTIIIHYTGMETAQGALQRLCDPASKVSAHYMIDLDGTTHALVDEDKRAWHAGVSYWRGRTQINNNSIGIELVNRGHEFGYAKFPELQMSALITLCKAIQKRHPIKPELILAHSDIAPTRKIDPGEKFNWKSLAKKHGIGLWPEPEKSDHVRAKLYESSKTLLNDALTEIGYDPDAPLEIKCRAFNLHYAASMDTTLKFDTLAMLAWMKRMTPKP